MTNGFKKHGMKHTSASQINMFEECPSAWVAKYMYGHKFAFGVAPQIGILTERVVAQTITGEKSYEDALKLARDDFKKQNALNTNDCLLYTSPSPRDKRQSRMPSSA